MDLVWELVIDLLEFLIFMYYINSRLTSRNFSVSIHFFRILSLIIYTILMLICEYLRFLPNGIILISGVTNVIYALIFFKNDLAEKLFWSLLYPVICFFSEFLTYLLPQLFFKGFPWNAFQRSFLRKPLTILYILLIIAFIGLLQIYKTKNIQMNFVQKTFSVIIVLLGWTIGRALLEFSIYSYSVTGFDFFTSGLIIVTSLFLILFFLLIIYIYWLGYTNRMNSELTKQAHLNELEHQEYNNILASTENLRKMKHDMELHLENISAMAERNHDTEIEEYIDTYYKEVSHAHTFPTTGNTAIDCVLGNKLAYANANGIAAHYSVMLPDKLPFTAVELSSLLGNLWNNALEASILLKQTASENSDIVPEIDFYIKPFQNMTVIHIENNYSGETIKSSSGNYKTMKKEKDHGIGLKRIQELTEQAGGILRITDDNHRFIVHIMIPEQDS